MAEAGAEYLASIYGTEKDRVNCPFYYKIGACRHGDKCSRKHNKPLISPTLLFPKMYINPALQADELGNSVMSERDAQDHFDNFFEVRNYAWFWVPHSLIVRLTSRLVGRL